jgi:hypothetical protein
MVALRFWVRRAALGIGFAANFLQNAVRLNEKHAWKNIRLNRTRLSRSGARFNQ